MAFAKVFELHFREGQGWSVREIVINSRYVVRVVESDRQLVDMQKEGSEAVKKLDPKVEVSKVIYVEGQHATSLYVIGGRNVLAEAFGHAA